MAKTYTYTARDRNGQLIAGKIMAENKAAVAAFIRNRGHYVTGIREKQEGTIVSVLADRFKRVTIKELSILCRQFATMFSAGLPLISCLNILIEQTYNPRLKQALREILMQVQEGTSLSKAMGEYPAIFPEIMVSMIEAGEVGGGMEHVLERLALQFEKEYKLNEKLKSAVTYPCVVMCIAAASLVFILTFVLPTFLKLYEGMNIQLPPPTRVVLTISSYITEHCLLLAGVSLAVSYGLILVIKDAKGRRYIDCALLKMPVLGMLLRKAAIARFSRTLATLVKGGVPIISALEVAKKTAGSISMLDTVTLVQESIREGLSLAAPLGASNFFTPMVVQMVAVGEETGELDGMLEKIADFYDSDVEDCVVRFSSMLEPLLICFLGVIIGSIIIAVVLPLFEVVTNIQQEL